MADMAMPCPLCDDTGWKPVEVEGVRRVVRCDCWREQVGQQRLADANIPKRYQHCTLDNFTAYNESLEQAVLKARRVAESFPVSTRGLLLEGQPGVGKTHLAVAVLKQVIQTSGARGLFYDTRDLLRVIRSTYDPSIRTTELEILRPVMTADLLVLDDLGAEKTSEWVEETMNLIVNTRYNEKRLTIFTSNYQDIPDDTEPNSLLFRIGYRMRSRLHEMCEFVEMDGADYRELPVNGGVDDLVTLWKMRKKASLPRARRPPGTGPAPRARRARRPRRSQMAGWAGRKLGANRRHIADAARSVRPHPFLLGDLQLLQLQPRPVRRRPEDPLRRGARRGNPQGQVGQVGPVGRWAHADTIFFGGGTPSLLEPDEIARIIAACDAAFAVSADREVTLEANPETVTEARLAAFREAGVNRVSFGVQSFREDELRRLSRLHGVDRANAAVAEARAAGFDNVSLDLMMWLPGQRVSEWLESVDEAIALAPEHLSLYLLEVYPNAPLRDEMARAHWSQAPDDDAAAMYLTAMERLDGAGYEQYEISNVARPGRQSRHNLKYWTDGEWLGFGCGAHSTRGGVRWKNVSSTEEYVDRISARRVDGRRASTARRRRAAGRRAVHRAAPGRRN